MAASLYRVQEGDFVYNRLFAWMGSFAVATFANSGCYVSNEFPCFRIDTERMIPEFLWFYFSRQSAWSEVFGLSSGSTPTSRNRLKEKRLLDMQISLPPMDEQRSFVSRMQNLMAKTDLASAERAECEDDLRSMLLSAFWRISGNAPRAPMREVAPLVRRPVEVDPSADYLELGIRSFGRGTFHKAPISGAELGAKKVFKIEPGDLIFTNVFAWEGAIAVAKLEDAGRVGSHRYITCVPEDRVATAVFLCFYFLTNEGLDRIGAASPGGAGRNRTLGLAALGKIEVPIPDYQKQLWFGQLLTRVEEIRGLYNDSSKDVDALSTACLNRWISGVTSTH